VLTYFGGLNFVQTGFRAVVGRSAWIDSLAMWVRSGRKILAGAQFGGKSVERRPPG